VSGIKEARGRLRVAVQNAPCAGGELRDGPKVRERLRYGQTFLSALMQRDRLVVRVVLARAFELGECIGNRAQIFLGDAPNLAPEEPPLPLSSRDGQTHAGQRNQSTNAPQLSCGNSLQMA
jgi:hypothetical protein